MSSYRIQAPFSPAGDQGQAIIALSQGLPGKSTLLGVTGSGKTYTVAQVIASQSQPVIVLAPNKTLAAQLYEEFSQFFPNNKVCYFVSYYDHYRPECYQPGLDLYMPKEAKINSEIERLRVEATACLITRSDTIIIASVSSIYALGDPSDYRTAALTLTLAQQISQAAVIAELVRIQYRPHEFERGVGTVQQGERWVELSPPYLKERIRFEWNEQGVSRIALLSKVDDMVIIEEASITILPARHFVASEEKLQRALVSIRAELEQWLPKLAEEEYRIRLRSRVERDLELLETQGYCPGIENYSVHFDGRSWGHPPYCLFDFFENPLVIIDESHLMLPQLQGMYAGDRARKDNLVKFGFRLPSAYDNRPLRFEEIERYFRNVIFVSATPGEYELAHSDQVVEQIVRPTGLVDPRVEVRGRPGQLDNLLVEIQHTKKKGGRTLVTVLTKRLAEDLALYLEGRQINVCYLHSDLKTPQRTEILHKLRSGIFDCVVGVNLLREGLDLPEVALVAIMDADIEGFLRDKRSLIQTIGRAARNSEAKVILYADKITESMRIALDETERRRAMQQQHNQTHNITPRTATRTVTKSISPIQKAIDRASKPSARLTKRALQTLSQAELNDKITRLETSMQDAAAQHDYDTAIHLRDQWFALTRWKQELLELTPDNPIAIK